MEKRGAFMRDYWAYRKGGGSLTAKEWAVECKRLKEENKHTQVPPATIGGVV